MLFSFTSIENSELTFCWSWSGAKPRAQLVYIRKDVDKITFFTILSGDEIVTFETGILAAIALCSSWRAGQGLRVCLDAQSSGWNGLQLAYDGTSGTTASGIGTRKGRSNETEGLSLSSGAFNFTSQAMQAQ